MHVGAERKARSYLLSSERENRSGSAGVAFLGALAARRRDCLTAQGSLAIPVRLVMGDRRIRRGRRTPARIDGSEAADDVLAYMHFPRGHWRQLHSTDSLERIHKEIKRRTRVVGIFPNRDSLMRMVATLLQEQDDEWQVMDRRYFSIESMRRINEQLEGGETPKELLAAIA
jgi:hypothetical protein